MRKHETGVRDLTPVAKELGYYLDGHTKDRHLRWKHPCGTLVITVSYIATDRHRQNAIAELRKGIRRMEQR